MHRNVEQISRKPLAARLTDTRDVTFKMILTRAIRILAPLRPPPPSSPILHLPIHTRGADSGGKESGTDRIERRTLGIGAEFTWSARDMTHTVSPGDRAAVCTLPRHAWCHSQLAAENHRGIELVIMPCDFQYVGAERGAPTCTVLSPSFRPSTGQMTGRLATREECSFDLPR